MSRKKAKTSLVPIYYNFGRLKSTGASTLVAVGGKGIGKTWDGRDECIDAAASGRRFVYIRKWHSQITYRKCAELFVKQDATCRDRLGSTIDFPAGKMAFVNSDTKEVYGWATSLEDAYEMKGQDYPGVRTIFFDEFLDGDRMEDEFARYQNVISTITRHTDDVTIFLCANSITRDNCYFRNFGIDIAKMKPGDIAVVKHALGATVAVEYCRSNVYVDPNLGRVSNKYVGFDRGPDTRMILFGEWTHPPIETREIDGYTWVSERTVFPVYVYIQGSFFEMSVSFAGEVAYVRKVNARSDRIGLHIRKIVTSEFSTTFTHPDGSIVPKYLTFASTGNDDLLEYARLFRQFRTAGRIIGVDPVDTHDFLRFFDSMPL